MTIMDLRSVSALVIAITLSSASAQVLSQSAVSSILQDILSPANTEKAMQLIKVAASRSNNGFAIPEISRAVTCGEVLPGRILASNDYLPRSVIASNGYPPARAVASELPVRVIINDGYGPQKVVRQVPIRECNNVQGSLMDSLVIPKEIFQPFPMGLQREACPCQGFPFNPYLPIASPVSAISPANMPPPTQSRGQFLRKIPIPPPSL